MTGIFAELKRRNVFRVGVAYVIAAWVVAQVADLVLENIGAPAWVMQSLLLLLTIGFVAALIIAWAYEVTPEGIKRERDVVRDDSITYETGKRLNIITIGLVLVAIVLLLADWFVWEHSRPEPATPLADGAELTPDRSTTKSVEGLADNSARPAAPEKSIAVLPFVNMSADSDQEYFADGISEEILNALVKADGLRVSGRTSSFSFKGTGANIQEIGRSLNVAHVLEGSVRKQANQVRITAQLIKVDDGFHMWSETYDRSLENIFDVQDDISRQVSKELLRLLRVDNQRLAKAMTENMEAYDHFLRGRDYVGKRINDNLWLGMELLEKAVAMDPTFAEAWATLAEAEVVAPNYVNVDSDEANARARVHAEMAMALNPTLALPHAVIGLMEKDEGRILDAQLQLERAHEMEPNNVLVLRWLGTISQSLGLFDRALDIFEQASTLDPMSRTESFNHAVALFSLGNLDEAERQFEKTRQLQNETPGPYVGDIRFVRGDIEGAIDFFLRMHDEGTALGGTDGFWSRADAEVFARGVYSGAESDRQAALDLEHFFFIEGDDLRYWQVHEHIKIGNYARAFEILEERPGFFSNLAADAMWLPLPRTIEFRQHEDFPALLDRNGYVDAWQYLGWPDLCRPDPGTDGSDGQFTCD